MMNVTALTSAGGAAGYLTQDNYYLEKGEAAAQFYGQGAEKLGLTEQAVTNENVTALLKGELPDGSQVGKSDNHRPGWDATFSAPKSVSIQALVAGDERIQAAHDQAVKTALDHYENHITTRQRVDGKIERQITRSLVSATFQHQTSRNLDPQLHTHAVVMNVTQGQNGDWRSVSSESLYRMQRELDQVYKTELEARLNELGYRTEKNDQGFELKSVPEWVREGFSSRSAQVEAELAKHNLTRQDSTAEQRQTATLKTRKAKPNEQNLQVLQRSWKQQAKDIGLQPEPRPNNQHAQRLYQSQQALSERVSHTIAVLTEKDAVISEGATYRHINGTDQPAVSKQQLVDTLKQLKSEGKLHRREISS
jgi:conjugative relaxase-like TrwC/TraI family protein